MILQLEIEQFIKDIESKVKVLPEDQKQKAIDKIRLLNRIKSEINDLYTELNIKDKAVQVQEIEIMKLKQSIGPLLKDNEELRDRLMNDF